MQPKEAPHEHRSVTGDSIRSFESCENRARDPVGCIPSRRQIDYKWPGSTRPDSTGGMRAVSLLQR